MSDFSIQSTTGVSGVSLITPNHEDAYNFLRDECDLNILANGSAPIDTSLVGDFMSDCASVYLDCEYL